MLEKLKEYRVDPTLSWNSTGKIGHIGWYRAEKPNVEVTVGVGPMPPDASDFPGGIPAIRGVIRSYLDGRSQVVRVDGKLSRERGLHPGVPQGSLLGPVLFIIYMNDLGYLDFKSKICLYADDSALSLASDDPISLARDLQQDVNRFKEWTIGNKLTLNIICW